MRFFNVVFFVFIVHAAFSQKMNLTLPQTLDRIHIDGQLNESTWLQSPIQNMVPIDVNVDEQDAPTLFFVQTSAAFYIGGSLHDSSTYQIEIQFLGELAIKSFVTNQKGQSFVYLKDKNGQNRDYLSVHSITTSQYKTAQGSTIEIRIPWIELDGFQSLFDHQSWDVRVIVRCDAGDFVWPNASLPFIKQQKISSENFAPIHMTKKFSNQRTQKDVSVGLGVTNVKDYQIFPQVQGTHIIRGKHRVKYDVLKPYYLEADPVEPFGIDRIRFAPFRQETVFSSAYPVNRMLNRQNRLFNLSHITTLHPINSILQYTYRDKKVLMSNLIFLDKHRLTNIAHGRVILDTTWPLVFESWLDYSQSPFSKLFGYTLGLRTKWNAINDAGILFRHQVLSNAQSQFPFRLHAHVQRIKQVGVSYHIMLDANQVDGVESIHLEDWKQYASVDGGIEKSWFAVDQKLYKVRGQLLSQWSFSRRQFETNRMSISYHVDQHRGVRWSMGYRYSHEIVSSDYNRFSNYTIPNGIYVNNQGYSTIEIDLNKNLNYQMATTIGSFYNRNGGYLKTGLQYNAHLFKGILGVELECTNDRDILHSWKAVFRPYLQFLLQSNSHYIALIVDRPKFREPLSPIVDYATQVVWKYQYSIKRWTFALQARHPQRLTSMSSFTKSSVIRMGVQYRFLSKSVK